MKIRLSELRGIVREMLETQHELEVWLRDHPGALPAGSRAPSGGGDGITCIMGSSVVKLGALRPDQLRVLRRVTDAAEGVECVVQLLDDPEQLGALPDGRIVYRYVMERLVPLDPGEEPDQVFFDGLRAFSGSVGLPYLDGKLDNVMKDPQTRTYKVIDLEGFVPGLD